MHLGDEQEIRTSSISTVNVISHLPPTAGSPASKGNDWVAADPSSRRFAMRAVARCPMKLPPTPSNIGRARQLATHTESEQLPCRARFPDLQPLTGPLMTTLADSVTGWPPNRLPLGQPPAKMQASAKPGYRSLLRVAFRRELRGRM
jgi:hypothetical protein